MNIFFVSGLPRAGSTLLMNLLGQNPAHHVTPTSGVIELFITIQKQWPNFIEFRSEGLEKVKPRIGPAMRGVMEGYFEEHLKQNKIVFDKSRGWLQYIEDVEQAFGEKAWVIVPIRDVREILASFEKLYRKRDISWRYPVGEMYFQSQTAVDRSELLLAPGGVVGIAINRLRDVIQRISDRLILVPFNSLTEDPKGVMKAIHDVLKLPDFEYDPTDVKQITHEDDTWHGMDLHIIRPNVKPTPPEPWKGVLPDEYITAIGQRYADVNQLCVPPQTAEEPKSPEPRAIVNVNPNIQAQKQSVEERSSIDN